MIRKNEGAAKRVEKTVREWKALLTEEEFYVTRLKRSKADHKPEMAAFFEPAFYTCKCCGVLLLDLNEKLENTRKWASFHRLTKITHIVYHKLKNFEITKIEMVCDVCDAHLGYLFQTERASDELNYCFHSVSIQKKSKNVQGNRTCGIDRDSNPCGDASDY